MGLFFGRSRRSSRPKSFLASLPLIRWFGPGISVAGILGTAFMVVTGRIDFNALDFMRGEDPIVDARTVNLKDLGERGDSTIRIASFNIQNFSDNKADDPEVMGALANIVTSFDVVAIQEIVSKGKPAQKLLDLINRSGGAYRMVVSEPIGRTSQTECYAFFWDARRIALIPESHYVVRDETDRMHREPFVASFKTTPVPKPGRRPFSFTLVNVHTDPDEVSQRDPEGNELNVLDDVYSSVRLFEYQRQGEDDFILLGDLNVDSKGFAELGDIPGVVSQTGDLPTNLAGTKTYDHIVLDKTITLEVTNRQGVVDLRDYLSLTADQAKRISDHFPVFAEFNMFESETIKRTVATKPEISGRR